MKHRKNRGLPPVISFQFSGVFPFWRSACPNSTHRAAIIDVLSANMAYASPHTYYRIAYRARSVAHTRSPSTQPRATAMHCKWRDINCVDRKLLYDAGGVKLLRLVKRESTKIEYLVRGGVRRTPCMFSVAYFVCKWQLAQLTQSTSILFASINEQIKSFAIN